MNRLSFSLVLLCGSSSLLRYALLILSVDERPTLTGTLRIARRIDLCLVAINLCRPLIIQLPQRSTNGSDVLSML